MLVKSQKRKTRLYCSVSYCEQGHVYFSPSDLSVEEGLRMNSKRPGTASDVAVFVLAVEANNEVARTELLFLKVSGSANITELVRCCGTESLYVLPLSISPNAAINLDLRDDSLASVLAPLEDLTVATYWATGSKTSWNS